MELRIVDFEKLSRHYKKYREGLDIIDFHKNNYIELIEPIKKEMNTIIKSLQSGIVMDNRTQKERQERFQKLQEEVMSIDKNATKELTELRDKLTKEVYSELESLISEWAQNNSIDLVMGKIECVYVSEKNEVTNDILNIFKEKEVYLDYVEESEEKEKESV